MEEVGSQRVGTERLEAAYEASRTVQGFITPEARDDPGIHGLFIYYHICFLSILIV